MKRFEERKYFLKNYTKVTNNIQKNVSDYTPKEKQKIAIVSDNKPVISQSYKNLLD